jgi:arylsulfatase A-like enzyme
MALSLWGPVGCSRQAGEEANQPPPNVVLIVLDTLRADHLSCYGYERKTSPNIDRFAETATLYGDCVSTAPWTLPAHASLFTGKYPFEHGAYTSVSRRARMADAYPLPSEQLTLAEFLHAEGYKTGAFVANAVYCSRWTGLDQGFDRYFVKYMYAEAMMPRVFTWLERRGGRPFFLFLNLMDTHWPLNVSPRPGFIDPPADPDVRGVSRRFAEAVLPATGPVPQELRQKLVDQYDTAVANVDGQIGRLLAKLRALELYEQAVIVITSDHGNYFGEHFLTGHSKDVYQPALAVPLIVKAPGQSRGQVANVRISLAMVPNLICAQLPRALAGRARGLFPEAVGAERMIAENYYSRSKDLFGKPWSDRFKRIRQAVFEGQHKYVHSSDGQHELYDLETDPDESTNLLADSPELGTHLARVLEEFLAQRPKARHGAASESPLSDEELRMMAELGYVDGPNEEEEAGGEAEEDEADDDD